MSLQQGRVRVDVLARDARAAARAVRSLGGKIRMTLGSHVEALMPPMSLAALSREASVGFVRLPEKGTLEAVSGEEVNASLASALQAKGITGKGVKVAIIDGGFMGLPSLQVTGDVPTNVTTADFCQGGFYSATEHGAAVTEVVHEMAPAAQLYLACTDDEPSVVEAEQWGKKNGAQIINFSVGYFLSGRGDGSGLVGSAVADARAAGILWVNAAGNHAQEHWSGNWTDANGNDFLDFAPGDETNSFVLPNGAGVCGDLKWDEWPTAKSDFDLGLYSSTTNSFVVSSTTTQNGTQPPIEGVCYGNTTGAPMTVGWAILGANVVSAPRFDLFSVGSAIPLHTRRLRGASSIRRPRRAPSRSARSAGRTTPSSSTARRALRSTAGRSRTCQLRTACPASPTARSTAPARRASRAPPPRRPRPRAPLRSSNRRTRASRLPSSRRSWSSARWSTSARPAPTTRRARAGCACRTSRFRSIGRSRLRVPCPARASAATT